MSIHPTSILADNVEMGPDCEIGPYAIIKADVKLGARNKVDSFTIIEGPTIIGDNNHFYASCMIGFDPQYIAYKGEKSTVLIGNDNIFREMVQVHRSFKEGGETIIGNKNFFMGNAHIAHDCILHNNIIMANGATLAGHVEVMDNAFLSGFATVIQFRRVGQNAFLSVHSKINRDVPPYVIITGERGIISGLNIVGIRRAGFDKESIRQVKKLYRIYFRMGLSLNQAHHRAELDLDMSNPYVQKFIQFIKESKIGIALAEKEESPEGEEPAEEAE